MGFGSVSYMATVIKNNRNMLSKKDRRFQDKSLVYDASYNSTPEYKSASPQLLRQIERRMTEARRRRETKIIIAFVIVMAFLIACLLYLETNYNEMLTMINV